MATRLGGADISAILAIAVAAGLCWALARSYDLAAEQPAITRSELVLAETGVQAALDEAAHADAARTAATGSRPRPPPYPPAASQTASPSACRSPPPGSPTPSCSTSPTHGTRQSLAPQRPRLRAVRVAAWLTASSGIADFPY